MKVPNINKAEEFMCEAQKINPGPWEEHSIYTGKAAKLIAEQHPDLDSQIAYILGYLHDIGRREGITSMRHAIDGYYFLKEKGFDDAARISITHSFPYKNINAVFGKWDCTDEEYEFVEKYLSGIEFNIYDRLIQLCDALALPSGFCLLEKRMIDVALRHGSSEYMIPKWKATFKIKEEIEKTIGKSIYSLLNGVIENTFEIKK